MKLGVIALLVCGSAVVGGSAMMGGSASSRRLGCPPDKPVVFCFVDPCMFPTCAAYPGAKCRPNYCGGCNAEWFIKERKVDCASPCSRGVPLVNCFANPCDVTSCPAHPEAECRANYCGGCNADFFMGDKKVNCNALCPDGVQVHNCLVNPCQYASCPADQEATCRANYCGGCNADWYKNGRKIRC